MDQDDTFEESWMTGFDPNADHNPADDGATARDNLKHILLGR